MQYKASILLTIIYTSMLLMVFNCSDDILNSDLSHSDLNLDTLKIEDVLIQNYSVAPSIGSNEKLYLGKKNDITIPYSFIEISSSPYWNYVYDSTVIIDSLQFLIYSDDSTLSQSELPNLYFNPDSQFEENSSHYLDYSGFSLVDWFKVGKPGLNNILDSSNTFLYTEMVWNIDSLLYNLSDTLDSNLFRSFAIDLDDGETFIEMFSEEASTGDKDPKIVMYYRKTSTVLDSSIIDTTSKIIFSNGDLSILNSSSIIYNADTVRLSNGGGIRAVIDIPFTHTSLPEGSLIRSANLILPFDTSRSPLPENILFDPIEVDSQLVDATIIHSQDPFDGTGYPYALSISPSNGEYIIPVKNILQNIMLNNENNSGFKLLSNEKNYPFSYIWLTVNQNPSATRLEIVYGK